MSRKRVLIPALAAGAVALGLVAGAEGAAPGAATAAGEAAEVAVLERPAERFDRHVELGAMRLRYERLLNQAKRLGAEPRDALDPLAATRTELREGLGELRKRIAKAKRAAAEAGATAPESPDAGAVAGVSQGTLEAIAACESGGDPTAVNPAGYYGKYQFDMGTWASVGGSGNPAEASEAEQDYRAALLYSRSGAAPWPVCGA